MNLILAAIRSGTDPLAPLPPGAFHRWLEEPIYCPKCDATYLLVADYAQATSRHFANDTRRHFAMLRKAIFLDHGSAHRTTHFETNGVVITRHTPPPKPFIPQAPLTPHIN